MKQILQDLRGGKTLVEDVPAPLCRPQHLRIATAVSLVSSGTERMMVDSARTSLLEKAWQQPEKVGRALEMVRKEGLPATIEAINSARERPATLGYCNVGRVVELGEGVRGFAPGDRVVSNGKHAEIVVVPKNLCARIPDGVDDESAAFTVLGAIALQGIRLAGPTIGEAFVVTGLGIIGLLAVQILRANGCRVLAIDSDAKRIALASQFGAEVVDLAAGEDPVARATAFSRGRGVDGVLLTASTESSEPVSQAARMCRQRGRIVLIGVTGLDLDRSDFYEKEISFQVSCSYGPGRYDPEYEDKGQDYPVGFVRWTEQRNFEAVLDMIAAGRLDVRPLITDRFPVDAAAEAYDRLAVPGQSLGILFAYPGAAAAAANPAQRRIAVAPAPSAGKASVGFIGAGEYGGVLIRAFAEAGAKLHSVVSANGVSSAFYARKYDIAFAGTEPQAIFDDGDIDTVCISTRHDSHARFVAAALKAGKHVFVEKPLCLTLAELAEIEQALAAGAPDAPQPLLMVGFNRRFAPMVVRMKALLAPLAEPKTMMMTVNAGAIPNGHWTQDPAVGGGRILGEACHFIDLLRHLAGAAIVSADIVKMERPGGPGRPDTAIITLGFADGSVGVINYLANGHKDVPKERLEIYCAGRILQLDDFRRLSGHGFGGFSGMRAWRQDKGRADCVKAFVEAVRKGGMRPIPVDEIFEVSRVTIEIAGR